MYHYKQLRQKLNNERKDAKTKLEQQNIVFSTRLLERALEYVLLLCEAIGVEITREEKLKIIKCLQPVLL